MRETEFRVWNGEEMVSPDYINRDGYAHWYENSIPQSSNKLMQYSGLKDSKDVKIFEGDIIEGELYGEKTKVIVEHHIFNEGDGFLCSGFYFHLDTSGYYGLGCVLEGKVVGNIHSNPELLKDV